MAIKISRNDAGNCINFFGTSNPTYWNAILEGEVSSSNSNNVNVINTVRTQETNSDEKVYEFYEIPYTEFVDKDGNAFENASECAQYITDNANVLTNQGTFVFSQTDTLDAQRDETNTTVLFSNGDIFAVNSLIALAGTNGTITVRTIRGSKNIYTNLRYYNATVNNGALSFNNITAAVNRLNEVFSGSAISSDTGAITGAFSTQQASDSFVVYGSRITAGASGVYTSTRDPGNFDTSNGMFSSGVISKAGEYFEFSQRNNFNSAGTGFTFGLFDNTTYSTGVLLEDVAGNKVKNVIRLRLKATPYVFFDPSGVTRINEAGFSNNPQNKTTFRLGLDSDNRAYISHDLGGGSGFQVISRTETALDQDTNLRFNVIMPLANELDGVGEFTRYILDNNPTLTWYYIESPDGEFHYPLFSTPEEAEYADELYGTAVDGSGAYHQELFPDEQPTQNIWYMPTSYGFNAQSSAPTPPSGVVYNVLLTGDDEDYVPTSYGTRTLTVDEGDSINFQIIPAGDTTTYILNNLPDELVLSGNNLVGTAPTVTGNNVDNPNDVYVITVRKTNAFGSSTGTLTLTVLNQTSPATPITGFDWIDTSTELVNSNTLADGSVVSASGTISNLQRYVIDQEFIESGVLPNLVDAGDEFFIGVASGTADWSSIEDSDWAFYMSWAKGSGTAHISNFYDSNGGDSTLSIGSLSDAYYDYGIEMYTTGVYLIACNLGDLNTQPAVANGGAFTRVKPIYDYYGTGTPLQVVMGVTGTTASLLSSGINLIDQPLNANDFKVVETSETTATFNAASGSSITLAAGSTYRFNLYDDSIESGDALSFQTSSDSQPWTTGISTVGSYGNLPYYLEFAVPSDVPPLKILWNGSSNGSVNISGSTYTEAITGITKEGPAANQTGTNVADSGEHGWISLDEQLSAGERLVMDNAFFDDFLTETRKKNTIFAIGLKGDNWTNTKEVNNSTAASTGEFFKGNTYIVGIWSSSASNLSMYIIANGVQGNLFYMNSPSNYSTTCAFLEITSDGNNIRAGMGRNNSTGNITQGDESTVAYSDWNAYKGETVNRTLGISSIDVVISFWTYDGGAIDGNEIDWTGLSEISVPTAAPTNSTSWSKAVDFSGGAERLQQVTSDSNRIPIKMGGTNNQVSAPTTSGNTTSGGHPWATAIVFRSDKNSSNQHIWNLGEGAGTTDDNIYLRTDSTGKLYFGWGRQGDLCEMLIHPAATGTGWTLTAGNWYGIYIAHNGTRYGSNNTTSLMADAFDIRLMGSSNNWATVNGSDTNLSVASDWTITGDGRMNRSYDGDMTIGGRGANRNFHGKVASFVSTTLRVGVAMPTTAEIELMITDPMQWLADYKVGNDFRLPWQTTDAGFNFSMNDGSSAYSTQVWLMGDGTSDSYSNGIRNQVHPSDVTYSKMYFNSMLSTDIETVSISGLT